MMAPSRLASPCGKPVEGLVKEFGIENKQPHRIASFCV